MSDSKKRNRKITLAWFGSKRFLNAKWKIYEAKNCEPRLFTMFEISQKFNYFLKMLLSNKCSGFGPNGSTLGEGGATR